MENYIWIDYIILAIFLFSILLGISRGIFKEIISIVSVLIALAIMIKFALPLTNLLTNPQGAQDVLFVISKYFNVNSSAMLFSFAMGVSILLLFFIPYFIGETINYYSTGDFFMFRVAILNRLIGGALGFVRGYVFNVILILLLELAAFAQYIPISGSSLVPQLQPTVSRIENMIKPGGFS